MSAKKLKAIKPALLLSLLILVLGGGSLLFVIWQKIQTDRTRVAHIDQLLAKLPAEIEIPVFAKNAAADKRITAFTATSIYVQDRKTGTILYQLKADQKRYPASTAKMMTAIVARKIYDLDQVLPVQEEAFTEGTATGFAVGEKLKVRDLLAILLIHSGNDAAFVLANNAPGGYNHFVELMNSEASQLGLNSTTFTNPSGLDDQKQQSTAIDLAKLGEIVLADPFLASLVRTRRLTVTDSSGRLVHPLINRNELLGVIPGVIGIKTGTTESAGENLVTAVRQDDRDTIIVLLGSQQRYYETLNILSWLDTQITWQRIQTN